MCKKCLSWHAHQHELYLHNLIFQRAKEVAEAAESNVDFMNVAVFCHVRQAVVQMVRQVKRLVGELEQKEVTGKVEYCTIVTFFFTTLLFISRSEQFPSFPRKVTKQQVIN